MAELFKDGFDHYGTGNETSAAVARMVQGAWAEAGGNIPRITLEIPSWEQGGRMWLALSDRGQGQSTVVRRVLPVSANPVIVAFRARFGKVPGNQADIFDIRNASNAVIMRMRVTSTGAIEVRNSSGATIASSAGPVVSAGTNQHFEIKLTRDVINGAVEIRVDETTVTAAAGLALGTSDPAQIAFIRLGGDDTDTLWVRDLIVRDTTGSTNNDFMGDLGVVTIFPVADTTVNGWTPRFRRKIGTGILDLRGDGNENVRAPDSADFDIGSGNFTVETWIRFSALPQGTNYAVLAQQWDEGQNQRSWQLLKAGPDFLSGHLVFRISTDGQAGTVQNIHSQPFDFQTGIWYHVAVSRAGGVNRMFVGGIQLGTDKPDASVYHAASEEVSVGGDTAANSRSIDGFMDEFRFTVGVGRYIANFTVQTAPFPRNMTDPDFGSVVWLSGWDNGIQDESGFGRTLTAEGGATNFTPDDGDFAFQVIDDKTPEDDTFVEAALIPASAIFTLTDNPGDAETVTIDSRVYTFNTVLGGADSILIGVDANATIDNLKAAINTEAGAGTLYGSGTVTHPTVIATRLPDPQMVATARTPGTAGNGIAVSDTAANGSWSGATLAGGQDIPGPSEFVIGNLPPFVTGIRSVTIINRASKSDAGPATMRTSFVGSGGASAAGAETPLPTAPAYHEDIFEVDPDTGGALTPATLLGARIRIDRLT